MIEGTSRIIGHLHANQVLVEKYKTPEQGLNDARQRQLDELKQRDRYVREHEASHIGSPGVLQYGAPSYNYQIGPDGRPYAIGGSVTLGTRPSKDPEDVRANAAALRKAALANSDPSSQDLAAASAATDMEMQADRQLANRSAAAYRSMEFEMNRPQYPPAPTYNFFA
ncbi:MAG: putative metalloprotease CJM1_0395 family protein [Spirochaetes bacterium]|jgi:hypothetical protein|nr:putative metalloprotease CJM1_0395 family protein [Spirochaetota bacterium]